MTNLADTTYTLGDEFAGIICDILGLDIKQVNEIIITARSGEPLAVTIRRNINMTQASEILDKLKASKPAFKLEDPRG